MTYIPLPDPGYISANGTCTTDSVQHVVALAPTRTGWWWAGYQAAIPNSGGGEVVIRIDMDGVGTLYQATADESTGSMYINHMGIHAAPGYIGPTNILRAYASKALHNAFTITLFLVFVPSKAYPR